MTSNSIPQPTREKKTYHKPEIEKVSLVLEEAVLVTGCMFEYRVGPTEEGCHPGGQECWYIPGTPG